MDHLKPAIYFCTTKALRLMWLKQRQLEIIWTWRLELVLVAFWWKQTHGGSIRFFELRRRRDQRWEPYIQIMVALREINLMQCRRDGNIAAHAATKMSVEAAVDGVWLQEAPRDLEMLFSRDSRAQNPISSLIFFNSYCSFHISNKKMDMLNRM